MESTGALYVVFKTHQDILNLTATIFAYVNYRQDPESCHLAMDILNPDFGLLQGSYCTAKSPITVWHLYTCSHLNEPYRPMLHLSCVLFDCA